MVDNHENEQRPANENKPHNELEKYFSDLFESITKDLDDLKEQIKPVSKFFNSLSKMKTESPQYKIDQTSDEATDCVIKAKVLRRMKKKGVI